MIENESSLRKFTMKKFAFCKCFYEQNIFIKSWNTHVTFKNEQTFRENYKTSSGLEEALAEAEVEIERRINCRESWKERRDKIEENYCPILAEKFSPFFKDFDKSTIFDDFYKTGVHWASDQSSSSTLPTSSKFKNQSANATSPFFMILLCLGLV